MFLLARLEGLNYAQIARELGIGEPDVNRYDREQFVIGSEAAFELNDVWTLRQNARYVYVDDRYVAQFDNGLTPYISYAESFLPQTGTDASGSPFEPASGKQYEVGIKYEPEAIDGFTPLSVYRIDQENMLTTDLANPMFSPQSGAVRSCGVELEGKLNVTQNLRLMAAVSRNQNKWHSSDDGREGQTVASRPPLTASAWVDYRFEASPLAGLGAGLGVRYVRGNYGRD